MYKLAFTIFISTLLFPYSTSAAVIINHNSSAINYGSSWDSPSVQVEQVLEGLDGEFSGDVNLTLVNGFNSGDIESWFGDGVVSIILEELAGYKNNTTFGWYDTDSSNTGLIFSGSDGKGATSTIDFGSEMDFGFYIDPNGIGGNRMFTEHGNNTDSDYQVAIFKIEELENQYLLGWEDLDLTGGSGGDRDYQDMIVRVTIKTVPEPSIIALFGLGLVGLGFARRRRQA